MATEYRSIDQIPDHACKERIAPNGSCNKEHGHHDDCAQVAYVSEKELHAHSVAGSDFMRGYERAARMALECVRYEWPANCKHVNKAEAYNSGFCAALKAVSESIQRCARSAGVDLKIDLPSTPR